MLKLVPFNSSWVTSDKIDIHAIYRRPRFVHDTYGELQRQYDKNGVPMWDLTGALPVRSHNRWLSKGFEYVTLADRASLHVAAKHGTIDGDWRVYDQHQTGGPWNYKKYAEGQVTITSREADELREDVYAYGSAAVETIRRRTLPDFTLPEHLRNIPPGGQKAAQEPATPDAEPEVAAVAKPRFRRAEVTA